MPRRRLRDHGRTRKYMVQGSSRVHVLRPRTTCDSVGPGHFKYPKRDPRSENLADRGGPGASCAQLRVHTVPESAPKTGLSIFPEPQTSAEGTLRIRTSRAFPDVRAGHSRESYVRGRPWLVQQVPWPRQNRWGFQDEKATSFWQTDD